MGELDEAAELPLFVGAALPLAVSKNVLKMVVACPCAFVVTCVEVPITDGGVDWVCMPVPGVEVGGGEVVPWLVVVVELGTLLLGVELEVGAALVVESVVEVVDVVVALVVVVVSVPAPVLEPALVVVVVPSPVPVPVPAGVLAPAPAPAPVVVVVVVSVDPEPPSPVTKPPMRPGAAMGAGVAATARARTARTSSMLRHAGGDLLVMVGSIRIAKIGGQEQRERLGGKECARHGNDEWERMRRGDDRGLDTAFRLGAVRCSTLDGYGPPCSAVVVASISQQPRRRYPSTSSLNNIEGAAQLPFQVSAPF